MEIIVQSTDGDRIAEVLFNLEAQWPAAEPIWGQVAVQAVIPLLMPLSSFGGHSVEIAMDGEHLKTIPFAVVRANRESLGNA